MRTYIKRCFCGCSAAGRLCDPNLEHYSITLSGAHTGAARVSWEHILSSEAFEVSPSWVAGSLKNKSNQINNKKTPKTPQRNKTKTNSCGSETIPAIAGPAHQQQAALMSPCLIPLHWKLWGRISLCVGVHLKMCVTNSLPPCNYQEPLSW